jgi:hypothetical protein
MYVGIDVGLIFLHSIVFKTNMVESNNKKDQWRNDYKTLRWEATFVVVDTTSSKTLDGTKERCGMAKHPKNGEK